MTRDEVRQVVLQSLTGVAPEIDPKALGPDDSFRRELDLDSMDFLNFVIALHKGLGVDVPEADYGQLETLSRATEYLVGRLGASDPAGHSSDEEHRP